MLLGLRRVRKNRGLTQEQLAEEMGVSVRTISRWETGHAFESALLHTLAAALDTSAADLVSAKPLAPTGPAPTHPTAIPA